MTATKTAGGTFPIAFPPAVANAIERMCGHRTDAVPGRCRVEG